MNWNRKWRWLSRTMKVINAQNALLTNGSNFTFDTFCVTMGNKKKEKNMAQH